MKKILVTGATGFVGRCLVPQLLDDGEDIRVFVRDARGLDASVRNRVEIVEGCLEDAAVMERAVSGCGFVLHLAALARAYARDPAVYFRVNTDALGVMLKAAARHGVERVVHVSSVAALPPVKPANACGVSRHPTPYGQSKTASELLVNKYVADGHDAVIVRPSRIYGPGPWNDANGTTRLMAMYLEGKFRFRMADGDVQANYVHVDDVATGIRLAMRRGRNGGHYNLGGENATMAEFLGTISARSGIHRRVLKVPPQLIIPFAYLCSTWGFCGGNTSITPGWINNFLEHRPLDISSSREDLGYEPRNLTEGVSQTLNWLLGIGGGEQNVYRAIHRFQEHGA